jgi:hypothetical protein
VPEAGLEPASPFGQWLLRPSSLPVSPLGLEMTDRSVAEMRTKQEVDRVLALRAEGLNGCEIARCTGIPRGGRAARRGRRRTRRSRRECPAEQVRALGLVIKWPVTCDFERAGMGSNRSAPSCPYPLRRNAGRESPDQRRPVDPPRARGWARTGSAAPGSCRSPERHLLTSHPRADQQLRRGAGDGGGFLWPCQTMLCSRVTAAAGSENRRTSNPLMSRSGERPK